MKQFSHIAIVTTMAISSSVFAVNPVQGFYGGLLAEVSAGPSNRTIQFNRDSMDFTGSVKYNPVGGGGGLLLGYRIKQFRIEGEFLYNRISYDTLTVGSCVLQSPNVTTPVGFCPQDHFQSDALGFNGSTAGMYALANGYYDFVTYGSDQSLVPYIGLGIGGAQIKNQQNFVNTNTLASRGRTSTASSTAAQGIIGLSYFLDDFATMGMDYRYLTTNTVNDFGGSRYALNTLNFLVNFSFDNS